MDHQRKPARQNHTKHSVATWWACHPGACAPHWRGSGFGTGCVDGGIQSAIMLTDMYRQNIYRENLHVEIAVVVSLLLHAFAFGTWQYRATLMKLPGLSSLVRLMHVTHVPPKPAAPAMQTLTFVNLDELKPKAEREKEQAAKHFMETDASQVTGEKPKDAKYYSDKSTVAANPKNPTNKQD